MSTSLYDLSVVTYLQTLDAVTDFMEKGRAHCEKNEINLDEVVETRLFADMLPFRFQIVSVAHHSLGAMRGMEAGLFDPPGRDEDTDYKGLQKLVSAARAELQQYTSEAVNLLEGKEVALKLGERSMPFLAEEFVMSFSLPNFYFHATTAYDILRMKGVPMGKRDFLGPIRLKK